MAGYLGVSGMTDPRIEAALEAAWKYTWAAESGVDLPTFRKQKPTVVKNLEGALTAALAAADAAAWRPIETAPKDKTHIDLWVINSEGDGRRLTDAYFGPIPHTCGEYGQYCDSCPEEGNFWIDGLFGERIFGKIIGWQPLPAPPEKSDAVGGWNG